MSVSATSGQSFNDPLIELGDIQDPLIAKYRLVCGDNDFASPLIGLLAEAAKGHGTIGENRDGILTKYETIVTEMMKDPLKMEIALASGSTLIDVLNLFYSQKPVQCYYNVDYHTGYADKIDPQSVQALVNYLNRTFGDEVRAKNPIRFFRYVYGLPSPVLWGARLREIRQLILVRGLEAILSDQKELRDACLALYPAVKAAFSEAAARRVQLYQTYESDEDLSDSFRQEGDCRCIVL